MKYLIYLLLLMGISAHALPKALVYNGEGVCEESCASTFKDILLNYHVEYVNNSNFDSDTFKDAKLWVQPGGYAVESVNSMSAELKQAMLDFIRTGGGYMGFCAGAFTATSLVGTTAAPGFGLMPGYTALWGKGIDMLQIKWQERTRYIYWEGGPYLYGLPDSVEKIAYYPNGAVAAARTTYGKGKVFISGVHPEAPSYWRQDPYLADPDGLDYILVREMADWVTH